MRLNGDLVGGVALAALGVFATFYAADHYEIGQLNRMGPGFFPVVLGALLAGLGGLIAIVGCLRRPESTRISWRALILVIFGVAVFALLLRPAGLALASTGSVLVASLADEQATWRSRIAVAAGIAFVSVLLFRYGLGMVLPVWPWSY